MGGRSQMLAADRKETQSTIPQDFLTGSDTERTSEPRRLSLSLSPPLGPDLPCSVFLPSTGVEGEDGAEESGLTWGRG